MRRFLNECRAGIDKVAPEARTNFNGEEIRGKFLAKLSDGEPTHFICSLCMKREAEGGRETRGDIRT